jgi:hypothetical protein
MPATERVLYHHLISRSPWRFGPGVLPARQRMVTLSLESLPRVGPFQLELGMRALEAALRQTRLALDRRITGDRVHV